MFFFTDENGESRIWENVKTEKTHYIFGHAPLPLKQTNKQTAKTRSKRQIVLGNCQLYPDLNPDDNDMMQLQQNLCKKIEMFLAYIAQNFIELCCSSCTSTPARADIQGCLFPDLSTAQSCAYDFICILKQPYIALTYSACLGYGTQLQQVLVNYNNQFCTNTTTSTTTSTTTESVLDVIQRSVPAIVGIIGGIGAITVLIQPPTALVTPQGIPPGNPLPGTPGILNCLIINNIAGLVTVAMPVQ